MKTSDKVILISGAGTGIGRAVAIEFAGAGYDVAGFGRRRKPLNEMRDRVEELGRRTHVFCASVSDESLVRRGVRDSARRLGGIDVLFVNAGVAKLGAVSDCQIKHVRLQFRTNVIGAVILIQAALPYLKERKGHVFINTSVASRSVFDDWGIYCATKAALMQITRALREELRGDGVKVTEVIPGATATPLWDEIAPDIDNSRIVKPESIAEAMLFCAGQQSEALTEEILIAPALGSV